MSVQVTAPLSEAELLELDEFLLSDACHEEALAIDETHGFITAMAVAPDDTDLQDWLPTVWGEPRFTNSAQRRRMIELVERLYDDIVTSLRAPRPFEPLIIEEEEEGESFEIYEGWCFGFMLGVEQNQSSWESLPKDQHSLLAPMAQIALLATEDEPDMDEAEYVSWVELIPGAVSGLYRYWHEYE